MDLAELGKELEQDFTENKAIEGVGEILLPAAPIDLGILLGELFEDEFTDGYEAFKQFLRAGHLQTLISFTWEEDDADAFESSLEILTIEGRSYLTISPDEPSDQQWEAFVAMDDATPEAWEKLVLDISRGNGEEYAMEMFSSLPTKVETVAVSARTVMTSFYNYLEWDESRSPGAWQTSAEYLPTAVKSSISVAEAAKELLAEDNKKTRFSYVSTYVAAVYRDPRRELAAVAAG